MIFECLVHRCERRRSGENRQGLLACMRPYSLALDIQRHRRERRELKTEGSIWDHDSPMMSASRRSISRKSAFSTAAQPRTACATGKSHTRSSRGSWMPIRPAWSRWKPARRPSLWARSSSSGRMPRGPFDRADLREPLASARERRRRYRSYRRGCPAAGHAIRRAEEPGSPSRGDFSRRNRSSSKLSQRWRTACAACCPSSA